MPKSRPPYQAAGAAPTLRHALELVPVFGVGAAVHLQARNTSDGFLGHFLRVEETLNGDPFHLVQRNLILPPVVELGGPWGLVVGDVLRRLERAAVLQVGGDAGGAEGVVADPGLDAGGLCPPLDHALR